MKRFSRWTFNAIAALSFLLCAATTAMWIRSYFVQPPNEFSDRWLFDSGYAAIYQGRLTVVYHDSSPAPVRWFQILSFSTPIISIDQWDNGGNGWDNFWWYTSVDVRLWLLSAVFATAPICCLIVNRHRHRPRSELCADCGYDIRATPERCPECGSVKLKTY